MRLIKTIPALLTGIGIIIAVIYFGIIQDKPMIKAKDNQDFPRRK